MRAGSEPYRGPRFVLVYPAAFPWPGAFLRPAFTRSTRNLMVARVSATRKKQDQAQHKWDSSTLPKWLDEDFYRREILPKLFPITVKRLRLAIDVSHPYATLIKRGDKIPHPRHWLTLAKLACNPQ